MYSHENDDEGGTGKVGTESLAYVSAKYQHGRSSNRDVHPLLYCVHDFCAHFMLSMWVNCCLPEVTCIVWYILSIYRLHDINNSVLLRLCVLDTYVFVSCIHDFVLFYGVIIIHGCTYYSRLVSYSHLVSR